MARLSTTHSWNGASLATYKASMQPLSDMFKGLLTQTTDTGQVNWTTMSVLPTDQQVRDYEVYRFNDTAQATAPVFVRVDYSISTTAPATPLYYLTIGSTTDGAGNLGGVAVAKLQMNSSATGSTTNTYTSYLSTDGSQISFVACLIPANTTIDNWFGFVLERFRNTDGTANAEGYNFWPYGLVAAGSTFLRGNYTRIYALGTQPTLDFNPPLMVPGLVNTTTFFVGSTEYAFPFCTWGPAWRGASQGLMYGLAADFPRDSQINITHYGKTAQFLALGNSANLQLPYSSSGTANTPLMKTGYSPLFRWE